MKMQLNAKQTADFLLSKRYDRSNIESSIKKYRYTLSTITYNDLPPVVGKLAKHLQTLKYLIENKILPQGSSSDISIKILLILDKKIDKKKAPAVMEVLVDKQIITQIEHGSQILSLIEIQNQEMMHWLIEKNMIGSIYDPGCVYDSMIALKQQDSIKIIKGLVKLLDSTTHSLSSEEKFKELIAHLAKKKDVEIIRLIIKNKQLKEEFEYQALESIETLSKHQHYEGIKLIIENSLLDKTTMDERTATRLIIKLASCASPEKILISFINKYIKQPIQHEYFTKNVIITLAQQKYKKSLIALIDKKILSKITTQYWILAVIRNLKSDNADITMLLSERDILPTLLEKSTKNSLAETTNTMRLDIPQTIDCFLKENIKVITSEHYSYSKIAALMFKSIVHRFADNFYELKQIISVITKNNIVTMPLPKSDNENLIRALALTNNYQAIELLLNKGYVTPLQDKDLVLTLIEGPHKENSIDTIKWLIAHNMLGQVEQYLSVVRLSQILVKDSYISLAELLINKRILYQIYPSKAVSYLKENSKLFQLILENNMMCEIRNSKDAASSIIEIAQYSHTDLIILFINKYVKTAIKEEVYIKDTIVALAKYSHIKAIELLLKKKYLHRITDKYFYQATIGDLTTYDTSQAILMLHDHKILPIQKDFKNYCNQNVLNKIQKHSIRFTIGFSRKYVVVYKNIATLINNYLPSDWGLRIYHQMIAYDTPPDQRLIENINYKSINLYGSAAKYTKFSYLQNPSFLYTLLYKSLRSKSFQNALNHLVTIFESRQDNNQLVLMPPKSQDTNNNKCLNAKLLEVSYQIYRINIFFKATDLTIDIAEIIEEQTVSSIKKGIIDAVILWSFYKGLNYFSAINFAEALYQISIGERLYATKIIRESLYAMLFSYILAYSKSPVLTFIYSAAMFMYHFQQTSQNIASFIYKHLNFNAAITLRNLCQKLSESFIGNIYDFQSLIIKFEAKINIIYQAYEVKTKEELQISNREEYDNKLFLHRENQKIAEKDIPKDQILMQEIAKNQAQNIQSKHDLYYEACLKFKDYNRIAGKKDEVQTDYNYCYTIDKEIIDQAGVTNEPLAEITPIIF